MEYPADAAAHHLAAIIASSDDAIVSKDLSGRVLSWNAAAERVFGYSAAEMVGQSIRRIIPEERWAEETLVLTSVSRGEPVGPFETVRRRKDGTCIPISLTVSPIRDASGTVIGASKIARDISAQKWQEARLARAEADGAELQRRLLALLGASRSLVGTLNVRLALSATLGLARELVTADAYAIWRRDDEGRWRSVRAAGLSTRFLSTVEGVEETPDAIALLDEPVVIEDVAAQPALANRIEAYREEGIGSLVIVPLRILERVSGTLVFYYRAPRTFTEPELQAAFALGNLASVGLTSAELYEHERTAREEARLANAVKDRFLATLSHELRTPLNAILGYSRMLRTESVPADRRERALRIIERNASVLSQIVNDVLDVSRIVSGKLVLNPEPTDLAEVIEEAVDTVLPSADGKGVRLIAQLGSVPPVTLDTSRLQQALWNVLSNAIKFTPGGGEVTVELAGADERVTIRVRDTGIGIPEPLLREIFEPFLQGEGGSAGGLGLGLAIARRIVELHGGGINASSAGPGAGATFELWLPMHVPVGTTGEDASLPL